MVPNEHDSHEFYDWDDKLDIKLDKDFKFINVDYIMISEIISEIGGTQAAFAAFFGLLFSGMFSRQLNKKMNRYMIDHKKRDCEKRRI